MTLISVIIPCFNKSREGNVTQLLKDISAQKINTEIEICKIEGVSPGGRARNLGAEKAKGDIFIFMDDDIRLGSESVLAKLSECLLENKDIGIAACSVKIPEDASAFECRYAKEIAHCQSPVADKISDVWVATSQCCAIRKELFFKIGKFNDYIPRGQDPELSYRVREYGYRTVIIPRIWIYHHSPRNIKELININFRNGLGTSFVDIFYPKLNVDMNPKGIMYPAERKNKIDRGIRFFTDLFKAAAGIQYLLFLSKTANICGYIYGVIRYRIFNLE